MEASILQAARVTRGDMRAALRAELRRREVRGEPSTPVAVFDAEAAASHDELLFPS